MKNKYSKNKHRITFGIILACVIVLGLLMPQKTYAEVKKHVEQSEITVKGVVSDSNRELLIGVSVVEKGTNNGTITDMNGNFSLRVNSSNAILTISYVGYKAQEINVGSQRNFNISLIEDSELLDEVVVTAYGTTKRASFTGSATVIDDKKITDLQPTNVTQGLQGLAAGVQVINNSGRPGADGVVVIRGLGSMTADSSPLYIIDGVASDVPLNSLSYSDIESMTILKDAASTSLYGSRAGNGIVMITTKKGKAGKTTVNLRANWGTSDFAVKFPKKVSAAKQWELTFEGLYNDAMDFLTDQNGNAYTDQTARQYAHDNVSRVFWNSSPYTDHTGVSRNYRSGWNTDYPVGLDGKIKSDATRLWEEDLFDQAFSNRLKQDYGIDLSGSLGEKNNYFLSFSFLDDKGVHFSDHFKRFTGRAAVNTEVNKYISLENSLMYTSSTNYNGGFAARVFRVLPSEYSAYAWDHEKNEYAKNPATGELAIDEGWFNGRAWWPRWSAYGAKSETVKNYSDNVRTVSALNIKILPELTYRTTYSFQLENANNRSYRSPVRETQMTPDEGSVGRAAYRNTSHTFNNVLTYDKTFNALHHLNLMVGQEIYKYNQDAFGADRKGLDLPSFTEISLASKDPTAWSYRNKISLAGFFGRANYDYKDRYYISGSIRRDGSSRFHKDNRWGTFSSVGVSWRITEEEFMKETKSWLNSLKLKASYGEVGNDRVGYYPALGLFESKSYTGQTGVVQKQLPNEGVKWETNVQMNAGIEFTLFDKLSGTFEVFSRKSKDLLLSAPLAPSVGMDSQIKNIGDIKNTGWEVELNYNAISTKDFNWHINVNATQYKNEITSLPSQEETFNVGVGVFKWKKGGSRYDLYAPLWADVNPDNGRNRWWKHTFDADGKVTGREKTEVYSEVNNAEQRMKVGSTLPDLYGSITNTLRYKNFDLSFMFYYSIGGKVYDYNYGESSVLRENFAAYSTLDQRWQKPGDVTNVAKIYTYQLWNANSNAAYSDKYVFNNDFLRLRNLVLGYNLPTKLIKRIGLNSARVYVKGDNLLTFGVLKNHGSDPENFSTVGNGANIAGGIIDGESGIPALRSYSVGINVQF